MSKPVLMQAGGARFLVESDESVSVPAEARVRVAAAQPGVAPGMDAVASVEDLGANFADVQALIVDCCNALYQALARIPHPEKVSVEFGVKLAGEAGIPMLTKASGECNFRVSVEWQPTAPR